MLPDVRKILFVTGTRADFGKLKPLMSCVNESPEFACQVFATGMHMLARYGSTINEIRKAGFGEIFPFLNQVDGDDMEVTLANTILGLSRYLHENKPDLIVVHGDRVEALAGAIVGALRNIRVAHVEGGEVSGTVDELMRHAISKLAHVHFVANDQARARLLQLGEDGDAVHVIGSPDIDVMLSNELPSSEAAKRHYDIHFDDYALAILHPVTTELDVQLKHADIFVDVLSRSEQNYIVIHPNNDSGSECITTAYRRLEDSPRFRLFPSLRFEYFLALLKSARFLIGNSSAGIHEAPIYGVPTINIGTRQHNRFRHSSVIDVPFDAAAILNAIAGLAALGPFTPSRHFGTGQSAERFMQAVTRPRFWQISSQKHFNDILATALCITASGF
jgi:UDP-N-acetylglucosamine 2-epimerase (hydrolysing)